MPRFNEGDELVKPNKMAYLRQAQAQPAPVLVTALFQGGG